MTSPRTKTTRNVIISTQLNSTSICGRRC